MTHQIIFSLICATTTKSGIDERIYATGQRISDQQLALVNLEPHPFHGEWNYTTHPTDPHDHPIR